jgi:hypothetical protein
MATFTYDAALKFEVCDRWRTYTDRKTADIRRTGGLVIIQDPPEHGPDIHGRYTWFEVPEDFLAELRDEGFEAEPTA